MLKRKYLKYSWHPSSFPLLIIPCVSWSHREIHKKAKGFDGNWNNHFSRKYRSLFCHLRSGINGDSSNVCLELNLSLYVHNFQPFCTLKV